MSNFVHHFGLTIPIVPNMGDIDRDGELGVDDVAMLESAVSRNSLNPYFDLNGDELVDIHDLHFWTKRHLQSYIGDVNLDGQFGTQDIIRLFRANTYGEFGRYVSYLSGDWTGDGRFNSSDLVLAFQDGGYELTVPDSHVKVVPEPTVSMLLTVLIVIARVREHKKDRAKRVTGTDVFAG
ncbi:MAG: hypothetical protein R3C28_22395 [Pirellulaceae bacterium]